MSGLPAPQQPAAASPSTGAGARRVVVCLADAEQAAALVGHLKAEGYDAGAVPFNGIIPAVEAGHPPLAVVFDGDVPALRDFGALDQLRQQPRYARTLMVYGQRKVDIGYVLRAMDAGASVFLFTPMAPDRLTRHLRDAEKKFQQQT